MKGLSWMKTENGEKNDAWRIIMQFAFTKTLRTKIVRL